MLVSFFRSLFLLIACLHFWAFSVAAEPGFDQWLADFHRGAAASGISEFTLKAYLDEAQFIPRVIELDQRQAPGYKKPVQTEVKKPVSTVPAQPVKSEYRRYVDRILTDARIATARERFETNEDLLCKIGNRFNVDPHYVVALWAIESDFGRRTGNFPVIGALATLAYEGRRGAFFRGELMELLRLIDKGIIVHPEPTGSWAGAMGQVQFMPTAIKNYAQDFDGDGHRDLWNSLPDALASAANYLSREGWSSGVGWGQKVCLPKKFRTERAGADKFHTLKEWRKWGLKDVKGPDNRKAALILPEGPKGAAFLVSSNFSVIKRWNRSNYFALAVCHLAESIEKGAKAEPLPSVPSRKIKQRG